MLQIAGLPMIAVAPPVTGALALAAGASEFALAMTAVSAPLPSEGTRPGMVPQPPSEGARQGVVPPVSEGVRQGAAPPPPLEGPGQDMALLPPLEGTGLGMAPPPPLKRVDQAMVSPILLAEARALPAAAARQDPAGEGSDLPALAGIADVAGVAGDAIGDAGGEVPELHWLPLPAHIETAPSDEPIALPAPRIAPGAGRAPRFRPAAPTLSPAVAELAKPADAGDAHTVPAGSSLPDPLPSQPPASWTVAPPAPATPEAAGDALEEAIGDGAAPAGPGLAPRERAVAPAPSPESPAPEPRAGAAIPVAGPFSPPERPRVLSEVTGTPRAEFAAAPPRMFEPGARVAEPPAPPPANSAPVTDTNRAAPGPARPPAPVTPGEAWRRRHQPHAAPAAGADTTPAPRAGGAVEPHPTPIGNAPEASAAAAMIAPDAPGPDAAPIDGRGVAPGAKMTVSGPSDAKAEPVRPVAVASRPSALPPVIDGDHAAPLPPVPTASAGARPPEAAQRAEPPASQPSPAAAPVQSAAEPVRAERAMQPAARPSLADPNNPSRNGPAVPPAPGATPRAGSAPAPIEPMAAAPRSAVAAATPMPMPPAPPPPPAAPSPVTGGEASTVLREPAERPAAVAPPAARPEALPAWAIARPLLRGATLQAAALAAQAELAPIAVTPRRIALDPGAVAGIASPVADAASPLPSIDALSPTPIDVAGDDWMTAMIERIETIRDSGAMRETRIRLAPDALGQVEISIRQEGDRLQVRINAETPAARALLAEAAPKLADLAEQRGLRLSQTTLDFGAGAQGQRERAQPNPAPRSAPPPAASAEPDAIQDQRIA